MSARVKTISKRKKGMFEEFTELLKENRYLIMADAYKCKARILAEVRSLQEKIGFKLRGGKNRILMIALGKLYPEVSRAFETNLSGENLFIFTNKDPFELAFELSRLKVELPASPGDIATSDVMIASGNTGLQPGPIISLFSAYKVPTKIVGGAIHITKDIVIVRKGEIIPANLASLLNKLGIKPIEGRLSFRVGFDLKSGILIPGELLKIEIVKENKEKIKEAFINGFKLSMKLGYVTSFNISFMISNSVTKARSLAEEIGYVTTETLPNLLMKAIVMASRVFNATSSSK